MLQLSVTDKRSGARRESSVSQVTSFTVAYNLSPEQSAADGEDADNPSPKQLAARHLESIGEPAALSQIESITFGGTSEFQFIQGWLGGDGGTAMLVSQGAKMAIIMEFPSANYSGEYLAYDGNAVTVGHAAPDLKSPIAEFLTFYDKIMKNGLLGGVYSNAWPLLNIDGNAENMRVRKTIVNETELYELEYLPEDNHSDMKICLYFDPETWRHVRTDYYLSTYRGFNATPTLTEIFDDFRRLEI